MLDKFLYFDCAHAISVHAWVIEQSGGEPGIRNRGLLESPLEMIQVDDYYPDLVSKITHLCYSINKHHAFVDGNKRASIALSTLFLKINGFGDSVKRFVLDMENIAVLVADNEIDKSLLQQIIESLLFEEDHSESIKLEIYHATMRFEKKKKEREEMELEAANKSLFKEGRLD